MVNQKSLANLKPNNRSQGKVRINLTLKPETIVFLKDNYPSVSQGIEEILSKSVSVAQVDRLQKKLEKSEKDVNFFANKCARLTSEILRLNEDPYSVHSKLEARCQELDRFNSHLDNRNQQLELENQNLKLELQNLKLEIEKLKSDNTHNQIDDDGNDDDMGETDYKGFSLQVFKGLRISLKNYPLDFIEFVQNGKIAHFISDDEIEIYAYYSLGGVKNLINSFLKTKSDNTHYQILEEVNSSDEPENDLKFADSHEENYTSIQHDYCDFIEYERISESVNNEIILSSCDLIRATIYSPVKKPLIDIRKSLDLVLGRFDCKISKIDETFGLDKSKKWAFKFECFDVEMSLKCLERVKKELSEQSK